MSQGENNLSDRRKTKVHLGFAEDQVEAIDLVGRLDGVEYENPKTKTAYCKFVLDNNRPLDADFCQEKLLRERGAAKNRPSMAEQFADALGACPENLCDQIMERYVAEKEREKELTSAAHQRTEWPSVIVHKGARREKTGFQRRVGTVLQKFWRP